MTGDMPMLGLGAIPSPPDARDFALPLDLAAPLPARHVATLMPPVGNQGNTGRCVAFACTGLKQWEERRDGHGFLRLDPQWLYERAQAVDGIPLPHEGTTCRAALSVLLKQGQPVVGQPATGQNRIAAYYAVPMTVDGIKRALAQWGPVLIASTWFNSWFRPVNGALPAPSGGVAGGHARLLFGWDDAAGGGSFLARNSWGRSWGVNGNSYDAYRYLMPALHDAWRAVDVIGDRP
jgi:hypothetical protein